ncbi:interferon-inducible protein gig2 [Stylonychia lemnae]|uniref:Interferon-inducible protein gig2 n=1 Tax=Stylonychia lemnae TaxID=5949 RepID=A0A078AYH5_STYLE|nr:interferon-inducible protein gig2 [Stylonychia lemnae]|eukprot:CDW87186.1 interferon-inducible protein gig2 [Stylonychia lemnae]
MPSCGIKECKVEHWSHYCNVCDKGNSDHLPKDCPQGISIYHGTKVSNISSIIDNGLRPSTHGRIGSGIYFAGGDVVLDITKHRGDGNGLVVFKCRVNPNYCRTGVHPTWTGVTKAPFNEWCLTDSTKYALIGVLLVDGIVDGDINIPHGTIMVTGHCKFRGNITVGTLQVGGTEF